ncbi:PAB-dependent poly(A)-specific ribonuclease subunit 3 [Phlyctochytrium planicorne]|nr:PAB-dependent poly(A)-specific ribonuclease subunit 3 [Phlyctochytrium planicorne]
MGIILAEDMGSKGSSTTSFKEGKVDYNYYKSPMSLFHDPKKHGPIKAGFFMADNLREELQKRGEATYDSFLTNGGRISAVFYWLNGAFNALDIHFPNEIHSYHNLKSLEQQHQRSTRIFGYPTWVFKAVNNVDGKPYVLRRIEALIFVHDYFPLAETLHAKHFSSVLAGVPEATIWNYICQIATALKAIHSAGLAARTIEPSKILITSNNRLRLNCCGIFDVIQYDGGKSLQMFQHDDLIHFGQLIVALACGSLSSVANISKSMEHISLTCSLDLKNTILFLLSKPSNLKSIDDLLLMIGPRLFDELNNYHKQNDMLEDDLFKEVRNFGIFKMLCYLGFINERPHFDLDPSWSETGDRYLLKLFRDYVFHQVDETGSPQVDFTHVITCLNKLEAGVEEKIMLMSRDEQSCLIVSYGDLKKCVETAYRTLRRLQ